MFWRRRKQDDTEVADRDLEPTVEPSVPDDPLETVSPPTATEAEEVFTPADDAPSTQTSNPRSSPSRSR